MTAKNRKRHSRQWFGNPIDDVVLTMGSAIFAPAGDRIIRRSDAQWQFLRHESD
jgi:hypothetical protein